MIKQKMQKRLNHGDRKTIEKEIETPFQRSSRSKNNIFRLTVILQVSIIVLQNYEHPVFISVSF